MDPTSPPQPSCMDCRWLDIQVDAGREFFWCFKKMEEVSEGFSRRKACEFYEPQAPQSSAIYIRPDDDTARS